MTMKKINKRNYDHIYDRFGSHANRIETLHANMKRSQGKQQQHNFQHNTSAMRTARIHALVFSEVF